MMSHEAERDPVEALAAEFVERQRRGEHPSIEEFTREHPELAEEIRDLFPTIAALEGWKLDKAHARPSPVAAEAGKLSYLGDYRIIREIGRGGMGIVYEAQQESLGRHVAVKVLPPGPLQGEKQQRRFEREAKTAARLHHTNIVPVFGVGAQDGLHYYVMQFIRGVGLDAVIQAMRSNEPDRQPPTVNPPDLAAAAPDNPICSFTAGQAASALRCGNFRQVPQDQTDDKGNGSFTGTFAAPSALTSCRVHNGPKGGPEAGACTEIYQSKPITDEQTTGLIPLPQVPGPQPPRLAKAYWRAVAQLGRQVASALDYAHSQNVLHRDIKPANLLLDATGTVWVADFGLAKVLEQDTATNTGDIVGTLQYMAPEQFQAATDARSDICSLGLTLYELLTLRPAFQDSNRSRLIHQITQKEPPRLRQINPAIPRDLETIVLKASARDPGRRYQSAKELHDDLQRFLEDRPIHARRVGYAERLGRWCRRNPAIACLTTLAVSLLLLVAAVATLGYIHTRDALDGQSEQRQRATGALEGEKKQRERAEAISKEETQQRLRAETTTSLSLEVLEEIFQRLAPARVVAASQLTVASAGEEQIEVALEPTLSPETAALLEKLLVFYDRLAGQGNTDSKVRRQAAKGTRRVGDIRLHLGQTEQALEAYEHAVALYKELTKQFPSDATLRTELAGVYNALGQAHRKNNQADKAKEAHLTAIRVLTFPSFATAPPATMRYELARTYFHVGKMARETPGPPELKKSGRPPKGQPDAKKSGGAPTWAAGQAEADQYLGKAVGLLKVLMQEESAVPAYRHLLALCYRERSTLSAGPSPTIDASDRKEAINLLEQLVKQFPHVPEYRFELSETLAWMDVRGRPPPGFPSSMAAEIDFQEALRLSKELVAEHPNVPDYQLSKAQIHSKLAGLQKQSNQLDQAEKNLRQAVVLQNSLVLRFPKVPFHQYINVMFQDALADVLVEQKKWQESRPLVESSIKQLTKMLGQDKNKTFLGFTLADDYAKLAKILRGLGQPELAARAEEQAKEVRQALPKGPGSPKKLGKSGPSPIE
jgi:serine/threonine protein kinase